MDRGSRGLMLLAAVAATAAMAACGSDSGTGPSGPPAALVGAWDLATVQYGGVPIPDASGTLNLCADGHYTAQITATALGGTETDSGTYAVTGTSWTQQSKAGNPDAVGTYAIANDTLTINESVEQQPITIAWAKTSDTCGQLP